MNHFGISSVVEAIPLALLVIDRDRRIAEMNRRAVALFGDNLRGRPYMTVLRRPEILETIDRAIESASAAEGRFSTNEAGREARYKLCCTPIGADGTAAGFVVSFEDVTELWTVDQMRRDFVANVGHELRTPLTAMLGFIETLRGAARDDGAARERFLAIMGREAARMDRLIQDLLSLSRVESQERQRPGTETDLGAVVQSAVDTLHTLATQNGVALELDMPDGDVILPGDADQLQQVFINLIENGIKYGGSGGRVTVAVSATERDARLRGRGVRIDVIDSGEGIPDEHVARLTERFYRIDDHRSREAGGTGLGLAIVKHIINRHRGYMRIQSATGKGSRFSVFLPADRGAARS